MTKQERKFPNTRMRRNRMQKFSRKLTSENALSANDIIWPVFIKEGKAIKQVIDAMPDVFCFSIDSLIKELENPIRLGLNAIALFPNIDSKLKDREGSQGIDPNNLICRAIKEIKKEFPSLGIICDIALDPFTDHGHDGVVHGGIVDNDLTLDKLNKQALIYAEAGCDIIAPSDMMDGRVGSIRSCLEKNNFKNTMIMSYAAKFSSSYYGPFRSAIGSEKLIQPKDKKSYQLDFANSDEAMHEILIDINEGADMVMIKPGMPYLDIVSKAKHTFNMPTFVYQVSGEYSMIMSAVEKGLANKRDIVFESMVCFKRAGADGIFTYFAPYLLNDLKKGI